MLPVDALERLFDELALTLDEVGSANESLFLTKLVLALADEIGDEARVRAGVLLAKQQLT